MVTGSAQSRLPRLALTFLILTFQSNSAAAPFGGDTAMSPPKLISTAIVSAPRSMASCTARRA